MSEYAIFKSLFVLLEKSQVLQKWPRKIWYLLLKRCSHTVCWTFLAVTGCWKLRSRSSYSVSWYGYWDGRLFWKGIQKQTWYKTHISIEIEISDTLIIESLSKVHSLSVVLQEGLLMSVNKGTMTSGQWVYKQLTLCCLPTWKIFMNYYKKIDHYFDSIFRTWMYM